MRWLTTLSLMIGVTCQVWPAAACDTALLLAIDVSNSVDETEYRLQIDGLADALMDPDVVNAIMDGKSVLSVMQWSGVDAQVMSAPWTAFADRTAVAEFALAVRLIPRAFLRSDTAPAEAVMFALNQFAMAPVCGRDVIDVSGDGTPNAGSDTRPATNAAERQGVTINGIAIESMGMAISGFYQRSLITTDGFVITARGHRDYPRAIRSKLIRELTRGIS